MPITPGLLDKERIVAAPGFNRWLIPPAALAIHLCIGMAYGFSVFWLPLSKAEGWSVATLGWTYTLFFVVLGSSAALFGHWLESAGPRKAGVVAALCWSGGLAVAAFGVRSHQLWLLWLGAGVIGGFGLGLGYISPVSTLIKWFPDRRGMATGLAIMGFGGGAMIGSPLADRLMSAFASPAGGPGIWQTLLVMAGLYLVAMLLGAFGYRIPAPGWQPAGWQPPAGTQRLGADRHVHVNRAIATPQFWLLWGVLCLNVSAGIGVVGMASPMLQEVFGGRLLGGEGALAALGADDRARVATLAAAFAGLLSLFNIAGRLFWASLSDVIGRRTTYAIFFLLGMALYAAAPSAGEAGRVGLFVAIFCVILTMYGGGFATIPAYLADLFGTQHVGAIHGRLLTAWSVAGVLGPVVVNYIREFQLAHGVAAAQAYNTTLYILAGFLALGLLCNMAVRPVAAGAFMTPEALAEERRLAHETRSLAEQRLQGAPGATSGAPATPGRGAPVVLALAWIAIGLPLAWGLWTTLSRALVLFR
jgi:MFS family permease